jgi:hypothetical protein
MPRAVPDNQSSQVSSLTERAAAAAVAVAFLAICYIPMNAIKPIFLNHNKGPSSCPLLILFHKNPLSHVFHFTGMLCT